MRGHDVGPSQHGSLVPHWPRGCLVPGLKAPSYHGKIIIRSTEAAWIGGVIGDGIQNGELEGVLAVEDGRGFAMHLSI